mgnify:CR=1 FL=1
MAEQTGLTIVLEPGRFLVGSAGVLLTTVLSRKHSGGKELVLVDAGMNDLVRPSHYQAYHEMVELETKGRPGGLVDVVGPVCETGDFLALDRELPGLAAGERLAVLSAGAYGFVMSSNYNARARAAEVMVDQGRWGWYETVREWRSCLPERGRSRNGNSTEYRVPSTEYRVAASESCWLPLATNRRNNGASDVTSAVPAPVLGTRYFFQIRRMTHHAGILIIDFGSQYTQLIARRVREARVYCEIHPPSRTVEWIREWKPKGIILSGGPNSVYGDNVPTAEPALLELGTPVLGLCYGYAAAGPSLRRKVERAARREYGRAMIEIKGGKLFHGFGDGEETPVWMSHGDHVDTAPPGYRVTASSANAPVAGFEHTTKPLYGVQFHPEVAHTPRGGEILHNFLFEVCGCVPDWTPGNFIEGEIARIRELVKPDQRVICGLSGGVDSSVAAVLVHRAVGDRLTCIFVDHGLLRLHERDQVENTFRRHLGIDLRVVDAGAQFLADLDGITDPELKRKKIGHRFIDVFEAEAKKVGSGVAYLVQGTLYPDVIESMSPLGGPSVTIKTHHNVGGLPRSFLQAD